MPTPEFFNVQPVSAALDLLFSQWNPTRQTEMIETGGALGRVLADAVFSSIDLPAFRRSTVDGYAVRAADIFGASQALPAYLKIVGAVLMGAAARETLPPGGAFEIHTGGMLPPGADAVVMVERTQPLGVDEVEVLAAVAPGENVVQVGEDVRAGALILPAGHRLRPQDLGGLLGLGIVQVAVVAPPRVGLLSGGDELTPPEATPALGQIRDINAHTLAALVGQAGGLPVHLGIARDVWEDYQSKAAAGFGGVDFLVMTAGSSVSTRDLTRDVINSLGEPGVLQHGLAVKPGKPTVIAVCANKPVIGLPGNPVSALLVARQIITPIIQKFLGQNPHPPPQVNATLTANIPSESGREDTIPIRLSQENGQWLAEPVFGKSNLIFTLINADGVIEIPLNSGGLKAGNQVDVFLFE